AALRVRAGDRGAPAPGRQRRRCLPAPAARGAGERRARQCLGDRHRHPGGIAMQPGNLVAPIIVAIGVVIAAVAFAVVTTLLETADSGTDLRLTRMEE